MRKFTAYIENLLSALTTFPRTERRGIVLISVIMAGILGWFVFRPLRPLDAKYLAEADRLNDSLRTDYYRRQQTSGIYYTKTDSILDAAQRPPFQGAKPSVYIELNMADSAKLCTVRGIGPVISRNIVAYRNRLGGFAHKGQLREVWGITDENFEAISGQFFIDTTVIQKINLNFAPANFLRAHPYFTGSMVNRVLEGRKLKGGWNKLRELVDNDILLPHEAEQVAPYVVFAAH